MGFESQNNLRGFEIALEGQKAAEKFRTTENYPLQTTDIWVFTHEDLRNLYRVAGFKNVCSMPLNFCRLLHRTAHIDEFIKCIDIDALLAEKLPEPFFGGGAFYGKKGNRLRGKGIKNNFFLPVLRSCLFFPWYIYKIFCMIYNKPLPRRSIGLFIKVCLFFPYYMLKIYIMLLKRKGILI